MTIIKSMKRKSTLFNSAEFAHPVNKLNGMSTIELLRLQHGGYIKGDITRSAIHAELGRRHRKNYIVAGMIIVLVMLILNYILGGPI